MPKEILASAGRKEGKQRWAPGRLLIVAGTASPEGRTQEIGNADRKTFMERGLEGKAIDPLGVSPWKGMAVHGAPAFILSSFRVSHITQRPVKHSHLPGASSGEYGVFLLHPWYSNNIAKRFVGLGGVGVGDSEGNGTAAPGKHSWRDEMTLQRNTPGSEIFSSGLTLLLVS